MKAWFAMLPALALALLVALAGCGASSTTVAPSETPTAEDYEAELMEQMGGGETGEKAKAKPAEESGEEPSGEESSEEGAEGSS